MSQAIITTERLRLREYTIGDEAELFDAFADPYARTFYPQMVDRAKVREWIQWSLRNYDEFGFGLWVMERKEDGRFLGDCGLTFQSVEERQELEIGYHVTERERRKGYATEAAGACLDFGFLRTPHDRICSIVRPSNSASCSVAARIHTSRREFLKHDMPAFLYSTTRLDWEARRRPPEDGRAGSC